MKKKIIIGMSLILGIAYYYIVHIQNISVKLIPLIFKSIYSVYYKAGKLNTFDKQNLIKDTCQNIFNYLNVKIIKQGKLYPDIPILYVSNHNSYLDSLILKNYLPHIKTVAKSDANKDVPLSSFLDKILENWGTIKYIRKNKESGKEVRRLISENIKKGGSVLLYPEGSSVVFGGPKNFFPGSFEVAYENNFLIQPITIKYNTDIHWGTVSDSEKKYTKKYHLDLVQNLKKCMMQNNTVNVTFHPVVFPQYFDSADHLKNFCYYIITKKWISQFTVPKLIQNH